MVTSSSTTSILLLIYRRWTTMFASRLLLEIFSRKGWHRMYRLRLALTLRHVIICLALNLIEGCDRQFVDVWRPKANPGVTVLCRTNLFSTPFHPPYLLNLRQPVWRPTFVYIHSSKFFVFWPEASFSHQKKEKGFRKVGLLAIDSNSRKNFGIRRYSDTRVKNYRLTSCHNNGVLSSTLLLCPCTAMISPPNIFGTTYYYYHCYYLRWIPVKINISSCSSVHALSSIYPLAARVL